ncbi:hypothetical protein BT63DRAFT_370029, partial [Microthyrium microscopicum]
DQWKALNDAYRNTPFQFNLERIVTYANASWGGKLDDWFETMGEMKAALRQGRYQDLNLYFVTGVEDYVMGRCTFPTALENQTTIPGEAPVDYPLRWFFDDGCLVNNLTIPGPPGPGKWPQFRQGKTAVHEVGHWLGLHHPWDANDHVYCMWDDGIPDTPQQWGPTRGPHEAHVPWDEAKDTCYGSLSSVDGPDNIHNYMDYSDDAELWLFTPNQTEEMYKTWMTLRTHRKFVKA